MVAAYEDLGQRVTRDLRGADVHVSQIRQTETRHPTTRFESTAFVDARIEQSAATLDGMNGNAQSLAITHSGFDEPLRASVEVTDLCLVFLHGGSVL